MKSAPATPVSRSKPKCVSQSVSRLLGSSDRLREDLGKIRLAGFAHRHSHADLGVLGLQDVALVTGRLHPTGDGFRGSPLSLGDVFTGAQRLIAGVVHSLRKCFALQVV